MLDDDAHLTQPYLFAGLSPEQAAKLAAQLIEQHFPVGSILMKEGDSPFGLYVIQKGNVDVYVTSLDGQEHSLARSGPGTILGEMSLLTEQPIAASVRAATEVSVAYLSKSEFFKMASELPVIYRNVGAVIAERLRTANQKAAHPEGSRTTLLSDHGAPPLLSYALACSMAWHTRTSVLLLYIDEHWPTELEPLALLKEEARVTSVGDYASTFPLHLSIRGPVAHLILARPSSVLATGDLQIIVAEFARQFSNILIRWPAGAQGTPIADRTLKLIGARQAPGTIGSDGEGYTIRAWASHDTSPLGARNGLLEVPAPLPNDDQALREGLLPLHTPLGAQLGWAARNLTDLATGLALGAGSEKGYAHIGVLRVLEQAGVPVDYLAGTSVGSGIAASYAAGTTLHEIVSITDKVGGSTFRLGLPTSGLLSSAGLRQSLQESFGNLTFEELRILTSVIATDLATGKEVRFHSGLVWPALLASMSIPGIYPPQRIGEYTLVDGGVLNPVPANVTGDMGADVVIAVRLSRAPAYGYVWATAQAAKLHSSRILKSVLRSAEIMQSKISTETAAAATVLIEPDFSGVAPAGLRRFTEGKRYISLGEAAARAALPRLAAALPWLRASSYS